MPRYGGTALPGAGGRHSFAACQSHNLYKYTYYSSLCQVENAAAGAHPGRMTLGGLAQTPALGSLRSRRDFWQVKLNASDPGGELMHSANNKTSRFNSARRRGNSPVGAKTACANPFALHSAGSKTRHRGYAGARQDGALRPNEGQRRLVSQIAF